MELPPHRYQKRSSSWVLIYRTLLPGNQISRVGWTVSFEYLNIFIMPWHTRDISSLSVIPINVENCEQSPFCPLIPLHCITHPKYNNKYVLQNKFNCPGYEFMLSALHGHCSLNSKAFYSAMFQGRKFGIVDLRVAPSGMLFIPCFTVLE
jgi:hypothetical protein